MKEQYIITDLDGDVIGSQLANTAQRAKALFCKKRNILESGVNCISFMDWSPAQGAGAESAWEPVEDENAWIEQDLRTIRAHRSLA